jgi:hypothetical protein
MEVMKRALWVFLAAAAALSAQDLSDKTYEACRKHILPDETESRWEKIPWRGSYWDGVVDAQQADKPILLWAMNGHALGCT